MKYLFRITAFVPEESREYAEAVFTLNGGESAEGSFSVPLAKEGAAWWAGSGVALPRDGYAVAWFQGDIAIDGVEPNDSPPIPGMEYAVSQTDTGLVALSSAGLAGFLGQPLDFVAMRTSLGLSPVEIP